MGETPALMSPTPTSAAPEIGGREGKIRRLGHTAAGRARKKAEKRQSATKARRHGVGAASALAVRRGDRRLRRKAGRSKKEAARGRSRFYFFFLGGGRAEAKRKDWIGSNPPVHPWAGVASYVKLHDFLLIQVVELRVTLARREL